MSRIKATIRKIQKMQEKEDKEVNHYVDNVDFPSELPRLIAQAKVVFKLLSPFFEQSKKHIKNKGVFLDIGAGPGVVTELLTEKFFPRYDIKALELSNPMIEFGRVASQHIDWHKGSIYKIPLGDESVDVVFSSLVLMHLNDQPGAVKEISRVLKKGGLAFIFNPNYYANQGSSEIFQELYAEYADFIKRSEQGDYGVMSYLPEVMGEYSMSLIESDNIISTNQSKDNYTHMDYPFFEMGKMTYWGLISCISQRIEDDEKIKKIFQKCSELYRKDQVLVYARQPMHLYEKLGNI